MSSYMALPDPERDVRALFQRSLTPVLDLVGDEAKPGMDVRDQRLLVKDALQDRMELRPELFDALLRAAVHDPDPSFNRWFVDPAMRAFGRPRVMEALLRYLAEGTNHERAGAARAWYWATRFRSREDFEAVSALHARWLDAALCEFITNEDIDVRRCILPGLPLKPHYYPEAVHDLVAQAIHIARTHPDEYLRHRVEHQV